MIFLDPVPRLAPESIASCSSKCISSGIQMNVMRASFELRMWRTIGGDLGRVVRSSLMVGGVINHAGVCDLIRSRGFILCG